MVNTILSDNLHFEGSVILLIITDKRVMLVKLFYIVITRFLQISLYLTHWADSDLTFHPAYFSVTTCYENII